MKRKTTYPLCLPVGLLDKLKEIVKQPPNITGFSILRLEYLINVIVTHKQDKHPGAYSVLYMRYLKYVIPRANEYLDFLRVNGIIEWKNYSAGRNSRLYRITKQYDGKTTVRFTDDQYLIRRIKKCYKQICLKNSKKYPVLNHLVKKVKIDLPAALLTIEETYLNNLSSSNTKLSLKAEARRTFSIGEVYKIKNGQIYMKVNKTNYRYDTNFTRLPRELFKHLSINGKPFTELDIRNSQPFFAVALFNPTPEIQRIISHSITMYSRSLHLTDKQDVILYISLVTKGIFYDFMMNEFTKRGIPYLDRDDFKEKLFTIFFGENNSWLYSPAVRLFAELFPNVYRLFKMIKNPCNNRLPILLQRIESYIMLDIIAVKIHHMFPKLEFLTKHDSLLPAGITDAEADFIKSLMVEEISRISCFSPEIRIK